MRLSAWTATFTSVARRSSVRARSPSPITRLKRAISASIVCSQSRKRRVLPLRAGRDDVADLDGAVGDDHAVNQQLEQCPLPLEVRLGQALPHTPAERLGMGGQLGRLVLALGAVHEVLLLALQRRETGIDVAAAPFVLGQRHHAGEVGLGEPLEVLAEGCPSTPHACPAGLPLLRQPMPAARPPHRLRHHLRRRQRLAQVAPDQILQWAGRDVARGTALAGQQQPHPRLGSADIVVVARRHMDAAATQAAPAAADQATQEIRMHAVVAPGHLTIIGQSLLRAVELRLADDGGHRCHRDPLGSVDRLLDP